MNAAPRHPQFWIDVGGTFTDCLLADQQGPMRRYKLLSSGVVPGTAGEGTGPGRLVDLARRSDPPGFWTGSTLQRIEASGRPAGQARVAAFDPARGILQLAAPLPGLAAGASYELHAGEEAPVLAIRYLLGLPRGVSIPPVAVRLGTTRGTNALLTRRGARTALVTTRGFGDMLRIGYQDRPRLFALRVVRPRPLVEHVAEIDERIDAHGNVLEALDPRQVRVELQRLKAERVESLAICLMNAYRNGEHERQLAELAEPLGFTEVSCSHQVAPLAKVVARGETTAVDAYLNPVLRGYVATLRRSLADPASQLRVVTSAGGLVSADRFSGKDSLLSGPAGGVVGFAAAARAAGFERAIGFDMGGTSTDVSRFDGRYELQYETEKAGVRIVAPMMAIETVAAGGGSICGFDGAKLVVGPDSAGAAPGPACYGRGGPLSLTDVNLLLGRLLPDSFPFPLDRAAAERQLDELAAEVGRRSGRRWDRGPLAEGFRQVANANMSEAIRSISVAQGYDPSDYVLVAFGGAAPQHACAVAGELEIGRILVHPDAGILSAFGIGRADVVRHRQQGVYRRYHAAIDAQLARAWDELAEQAVREVAREGIARERIEVLRMLDLRYVGQDACLTLGQPDDGDYAAALAAEHRRRYGYAHAEREVEIVALRVEATGRSAAELPGSRRLPTEPAASDREVTVFFDARPLPTRVYRREQLRPGQAIAGPAIITEAVSTTVVDPRWQAEVMSGGELLLSRQAPTAARPAAAAARPSGDSSPDPARLEIFNRRFAAIAHQMGLTLRNTASSVNVKERLDFSCAIFTAAGELVVNAPHIPVHLGAMSETVRCLIEDHPDLRPGDVLVTNDPYRGGSHLPDITVVTPLHDDDGRLRMFTASRAHHADVGGTTPGSMPPFSRNLAEEGVLIRSRRLIEGGQSRLEELARLLRAAPYPARNVDDNLADLAAQVAANRQAVRDLEALVERHSRPVVQHYMEAIQAAAEDKMRRALRRLPDGQYTFRDHLDDGSPIAVAITIAGDRARFDFHGTGPVLPTNLNANRAIVTAAVLYCLRLLIDEDIPLNHGVLAPVELVLPEACLLNPPADQRPERCPAVVGGNVETSQRVVDVILGALGLAAASQGTMNNLLFGTAAFGYYETIGGGSGATPAGPGADAVHTHMTNTRLTDPEILEQRYPVRLERFAIRRHSGGGGRHRGGDGIVRSLKLLEPLEVSLLTQRRGPYPPYGLDGGRPGRPGINRVTYPDGRTRQLSASAHLHLPAGATLTIETPGGGGYGPPPA